MELSHKSLNKALESFTLPGLIGNHIQLLLYLKCMKVKRIPNYTKAIQTKLFLRYFSLPKIFWQKYSPNNTNVIFTFNVFGFVYFLVFLCVFLVFFSPNCLNIYDTSTRSNNPLQLFKTQYKASFIQNINIQIVLSCPYTFLIAVVTNW